MAYSQVSLLKDPDSGLHFDNLGKLLNYVHYLSGKHLFGAAKYKKHGDFAEHPFQSTLFFDKYIETAEPDLQLTFLFETQGIIHFNADLDQDKQFKHKVCKDSSGNITEMLYPHIHSEHFNPYGRYCNSVSSASHQCSKLVDLAGVDLCFYDFLTGEFTHPTVFNELVLTYPEEISNQLLDPSIRESIIDRSRKCSKRFFDKLNTLFCSGNQQLGSSVNTHVWSSEFPFLPHLHHHMILPHFSYDKTRFRDLELLQPIFKQFEEVFAIVESGSVRSKVHTKSGGVIRDKQIINKYLIDEEKYNQLRIQLSRELSDQLGFKQLEWFGSHINYNKEIPDPLAIESLKKLWAKIVSKEFKEYGSWDMLDIKTQYIKADQRSKLLHALTYKTRPPVIDLDLFLKSCPDLVTNYNKLNTIAVINHLQTLFCKAATSDNPKVIKFERALDRAISIFSITSDADMYSWLEFLSTWSNNARVYGFWHHIKRYQLDPEHKFLIESIVCPLCGGHIESVGYVKDACIDGVILRHRNKFFVFDGWQPGGL